jgi:hypothetical protein
MEQNEGGSKVKKLTNERKGCFSNIQNTFNYYTGIY